MVLLLHIFDTHQFSFSAQSNKFLWGPHAISAQGASIWKHNSVFEGGKEL